jgi:hypothetical protein
MNKAWAFRVAIPLAMAAVCVVGAQKPGGMGFFITSVGSGKGGDLGGLEGADKHCQQLAQAVGAGGRMWRAYLSSGGAKPVHAKDRIGAGPWTNVKGVVVATSVADLHSDANKLSKENSLNEKGEVVNGRGDKPNRHDILTGSNADGTLMEGQTCNNWTSSSDGTAFVGHHDRVGGGSAPTSWNSSHATKACSQEALQGTGGDGLFYCFAAK